MKALPILIALLLPLALPAQYTIEWEKAVGTSATENGANLYYNKNFRKLWGGGSSRGISGDGDRTSPFKGGADYWIVLLDDNGNLLQDVSFGGSGDESQQSFSLPLCDGGIIGGYSTSPVSGDVSQPRRGVADCWVVRFDGQGNKIWDRRFGSLGGQNLFGLAPASDCGFLLAAWETGEAGFEQVWPSIAGSADFWLLRLDENGDTVWTRRYGGNGAEFPWTATQTPDGGWIAAGYTNSWQGHDISQPPKDWIPVPDNFPEKDAWLVRLDDLGNIIWERRYGGAGNEEFRYVLPLSDGSLLAAGSSNSRPKPNTDRSASFDEKQSGWLVHIDSQGNVIKDWAFGALPGNSIIYHVLPLPQGGFLLSLTTQDGNGSGKAEPSRGGLDGWVIQLDASFNVVWEKVLGGTLNDWIACAANGINGEIFLSGNTMSAADPTNPQSERHSPHRGHMDLWFLKLVPEEPFALRDTDIKGYRLEKSARITFAPQPLEVIDILVERTQDLSSRPVRFQAIAQIETGQVCGTAECQWLDREPLPGSNFYRLAYRLTDGSRVYSNIVQLTFESHQSPEVIDFRIYPNPTQGPVHLDFQSRIAGQAQLELFSTDGRAVFTRTLNLKQGANAFDLELDLPAGIYLMRLGLPDGTAVRERMLVR